MIAERKTVLAFALGALLAGCTAGSGPASPMPTGGREPAGGGQEPAATGPEPANGAQEPASGSGATTGQCPACNFIYLCTGISGVASQTSEVALIETDKGCAIGDAQSSTFFQCDGHVVSKGQSGSQDFGTWQAFGNGGFTIVAQQGTAQCVPEKPYTPPPVQAQ